MIHPNTWLVMLTPFLVRNRVRRKKIKRAITLKKHAKIKTIVTSFSKKTRNQRAWYKIKIIRYTFLRRRTLQARAALKQLCIVCETWPKICFPKFLMTTGFIQKQNWECTILYKPEVDDQCVIRGDPLQWTSEASETLCLEDKVVAPAASKSRLTMFFLFWASELVLSSETSGMGLRISISFVFWDTIAWASATTEALSSVAYRIFFIAPTTCNVNLIPIINYIFFPSAKGKE